MFVKKNRPYLIPVIVFIISICFSIVATYFVFKESEKIAKQQLEISATEIKAKIQSRLNAYNQFSQISASFFMASDSITRADWKLYVKNSNVGNYLKGFQGIAHITIVPEARVQSHTSRFKKEYSSDYTVFPEGKYNAITPIIFIEPLIDRNLKAIGYNISSNANMRKALEKSRDLNASILTDKVILIQEGSASKVPGSVIYSPIYKQQMPINTIENRRKAIKGWAAVSFRINDFMEGIIEPNILNEKMKIHLKIFESANLDPKALLHSSKVNLGDNENFNSLNIPINLNNKVWTLQFNQEKTTFINSFSFVVLLIGIVISFLISFLIYSLSNTANIAKRLATKLTSDLSKRNEEFLLEKENAEEREKQLKLISNNLVNGMIYQVISVDEHTRKFTYVSETVAKLYGCTVEQVKENPEFIYGKVHKDDIESLISSEKEAISKMSIYKKEARVINPDGSVRWSLFVSKPRVLKGEVCWDGIEIDITEQKNIENELLIAKGNAEESNRLKTEFLNNMSHEIRTPMNGILGFTDFLLTPDLSEEKRRNYIQIVQSSGRQLLHVIDDIIEISRLGTKQVRVVESEVCLNDLFLELFSIFDIKAKDNKIPLYIKNNHSDAESTVLIDKSKLHKILSNLLENSLKFTNNGFIEFGYKINENNELEIYVKDTGIGIDVAKHELIFERFSQTEKDLSKKMGGLGLGLSIVKENVELLGGKIKLESKLGAGATFIITLPYKNVYQPTEQEKKVKLLKEKYTILIAEDEEVNFLYLETLINEILKIECHILHAKNGKEAIEYCLTNDTISLVLMDLKMPKMTGFEAVKKIRKLKPELVVIAQSAYAAVDEIENALSLGFDDFISKPISVKNFKNLINKYLFNLPEENLEE